MKVATAISRAPVRRTRATHSPPASQMEATIAAAKAPSSVFAVPKSIRWTPSVACRITNAAPASDATSSAMVSNRGFRAFGLVQHTPTLITIRAQAGTRAMAAVATGKPSCLTKVPSAAGPETKWFAASTPNCTKAMAPAPKRPIR